MNKKLISAVLGTLVLAAPVLARAEEEKKDDMKKDAKPAKKAKAKAKKAEKAEKGGEKSCGADGKGCSGKK